MDNLYERLRERLDNLSTGFPKTESGIEVKVLRWLFNEEEAEMYLLMTPMLETPADIAKRTGREESALAKKLEDMASRGLLFRMRKPGSVKYCAHPFIIGILEYQLKRMDLPFVIDVEEYLDAGLLRTLKATKTPVMRPVPINRELAHQWPIALFDDVAKTIDEQKTIAVAECICRKEKKMIGKGCGKSPESCFYFGAQADFYVENGLGRYVNADEAKTIMKKNMEAAPLVIQMANTQKGGGFCMCCGDCCSMLRSLKMQPKPAEMSGSNYRAIVDGPSCTACEACVERCQMEAIEMRDGVAVINNERCIGCGNCVAACSPGAVKLEKKKEDSQYTPPENFMYTYIEIARERGKM